MIKLVTTLAIFIFINYNFLAQEISVAPINEEFIEYMNNKSDLKSSSDTGNSMGYIPSPISFHFSTNSTLKGTLKSSKLPTAYDLRDIENGAYLTSVRNQGSSGTCWAFSTYGSIESYFLKEDKGSYDFSEQNLATCHGFDWGPGDGGNFYLSIAYLSRHSGPILEEDDPYSSPNDYSTCTSNLIPPYFIEKAVFLPGRNDDGFNADTIKQAIIDNGALAVDLYMNGNYLNSDDNTYYCTETGINHDVSLVGWDDNKVVTGGADHPSSTGAWIIKNSWGENWGENGYFYVSYEDVNILTSVCYFPSIVENNLNTKTYYYDECGMVGSFGFGDESCYALVKYTTDNYENIDRIGTYLRSDTTLLNIEIYGDFDGNELSNYLGGKSNIICTHPGYQTFSLDNGIALNSNEDFYIKIFYNTPGYNFPAPFEYQQTSYTSGTTIEDIGKCWTSYTGQPNTWFELGIGSSYEWDLCIKAYTTIEEEDTDDCNDLEDSYTIDFNSTDDFSEWEVWDENNDNYTWGLYDNIGISGTSCAAYKSNSDEIADDWLISPCFNLESDTYYTLKYRVRVSDGNKYHNLGVFLVKDQPDFDNVISETSSLNNTHFKPITSTFTVPSNDSYHIGFWCNSEADMETLKIDNVSLSKDETTSVDSELENNSNDNVLIYPNPTKGSITINFLNQHVPTIVNIADCFGKTIYSRNITENSDNVKIDLSLFENGVYLITLTYSQNTTTYKVIKQ